MEGLDAAIGRVVKLADDRRRTSYIKHPNGRGHLELRPGGETPNYVPPNREYKADSIFGLSNIVNDIDGDPSMGTIVVLVGGNSATAVLDERGSRADQISLKLTKCESFKSLEDWCDLELLSQGELVWLLRSQFASAVSPESFLPTIRKLKFKGGTSGQCEVQHGRESMGLEVESEIAGLDGDIPDEITLNTPVFEQLAAEMFPPSFPVRCAVRVNMDTKTFTIKPLQGEVERAVACAVGRVAEDLKSNLGSQSKVIVIQGASAS